MTLAEQVDQLMTPDVIDFKIMRMARRRTWLKVIAVLRYADNDPVLVRGRAQPRDCTCAGQGVGPNQGRKQCFCKPNPEWA